MIRIIIRSMILLGFWLNEAGAHLDAHFRFSQVNLEHGLPQLSVTAIIQDDRGLIWMGTQGGLARYDGYEVKTYLRRYGDNGHSLSDNYITALAQSDDGYLWIATASGGLNRFNLRTEEIVQYRHDPDDPHSLSNDQIRCLAHDDQGRLWIGTAEGGISVLTSSDRNRFTRVTDALPSPIVSALAPDGDRMWVGTARGLINVDTSTLAGERFDLDAISEIEINSLATTRSGKLWVGSTDGLRIVEPDTGSIRHLTRTSHRLAGDQIESILEDRAGFVWVGTLSGLSRINPDEMTVSTYYHDLRDAHSLPANRVASMIQDNSGVLWFGTWTGGAGRLDIDALVFDRLTVDLHNPEGMTDPRSRDFVETPDGRIWIATLGGGVTIYDPATGGFEGLAMTEDGNPDSPVITASVQSLALHEQRTLWVGSRDAGLLRYDVESRRAQQVSPDSTGIRSPNLTHVLHMEILDDFLWVGYRDGGLARLNLDTGEWRRYTVQSGHLSSNTIGYVFADQSGTLWLGTRGQGLMRYQPQTDDFDFIYPEPDRPGGLLHGTISYLMETNDRQMWLATQGGGIAAVDRSGEELQFKFFNTANGLPSDAVGAVLADNEGQLWISTLVGLSRLNPADNSFRHFSPRHGTLSQSYYVASGLRASDGTLYFGGLSGVTVVDDANVATDDTAPGVVITEMAINNQFVDVGDPAISQAVPYLTELVLPFTHNSVSVEFSATHFAEPNANRYKYRLTDFNDDWIETTASRRYAAYTKLPAGSYQLQILAANPDGLWSEEPLRLDIRIDPPPWRSSSAVILYLLIACALILVASAWRRRVVRQRAETRAIVEEAEGRLRLALWGSGDELWSLNLDSDVVSRLGYEGAPDDPVTEPEDNMGDLWERIHPEDRKNVRQAMNQHLSGSKPYYESTYRTANDDGEWGWAFSRGRVIERDESGRPMVVAGASKNITQLKNTEKALRDLNDKLESLVDARTLDLRRANQDLREAMTVLTNTQSQLVESEKMASLGSLVAGVAHEINTPVGVALTAATYLEGKLKKLVAGDLSESPMGQWAAAEQQNLTFLIDNLRRAIQLIRSFKQVAVDQASQERREFELLSYLNEVTLSLKPRLKRSSHQLLVSADSEDSVVMESYPGAIYQIVSNLVINSLEHAFSTATNGTMILTILDSGDNDSVTLRYTDNGSGLAPEARRRLFEPFYTTRRGEGGSGLGMHIVYNLVTQVLGGKIHLPESTSNEPGFQILISIPRVAPKRDQIDLNDLTTQPMAERRA